MLLTLGSAVLLGGLAARRALAGGPWLARLQAAEHHGDGLLPILFAAFGALGILLYSSFCAWVLWFAAALGVALSTRGTRLGRAACAAVASEAVVLGCAVGFPSGALVSAFVASIFSIAGAEPWEGRERRLILSRRLLMALVLAVLGTEVVAWRADGFPRLFVFDILRPRRVEGVLLAMAREDPAADPTEYVLRVPEMAHYGREAVPALSLIVQGDCDGARRLAAEGLGRMRLPELVPGLTVLLKDRDPLVRYQAVAGLERSRDLRAVGPVRSALWDPDARVRRRAADALDSSGTITYR